MAVAVEGVDMSLGLVGERGCRWASKRECLRGSLGLAASSASEGRLLDPSCERLTGTKQNFTRERAARRGEASGSRYRRPASRTVRGSRAAETGSFRRVRGRPWAARSAQQEDTQDGGRHSQKDGRPRACEDGGR